MNTRRNLLLALTLISGLMLRANGPVLPAVNGFVGQMGGAAYIVESEGIRFETAQGETSLNWLNTELSTVYRVNELGAYEPARANSVSDHVQPVAFEGIYNQIDLVVYPAAEKSIRCEWTLFPGADVHALQLGLQGDLSASPVNAWQVQPDGSHSAVQVRFVLTDMGLELETGSYDPAQPLMLSFDLRIAASVAAQP